MKQIEIVQIVALLTLVTQYSAAQTKNDSIVKDVNLSSVSIIGKRPLVKNEGSLRTVFVKGSMLGSMGTLSDVLMATPGIAMKGNKSFEVIGKGVPKYYVDGKEVTRQDIFSTIKSNNIAKIEIEQEPSAKYPIGTNAVINIVTIKPISDMIALNVYENMSFRRKVSNNPSMEFLFKKGIWTTSLNYDYSDDRTLNKETYYKEIYHTSSKSFRTEETNHLFMMDRTHSITWGNDFQLSDNQKLGFEYYFEYEKEKDDNNEAMSVLSSANKSERDIDKVESEQRNLHNFSLSYEGDFGDASSLMATVDYSKLHNNKTTNSLEQNMQNFYRQSIFTANKNAYDILTLNLSFNTTLFDQVKAEIGTRYYKTFQDVDYSTNNPVAIGESAENLQKLRNGVAAGYITLSRRWKKVQVSLGTRYEYSSTKLSVFSKETNYSNKDCSSNFMPSAKLTYTPFRGFTILGAYARKIRYQGYSSLNPYAIYEDSLNYSKGNRDLSPSVTDSYALYFYWKKWIVYGGYVHAKNQILNVAYCPDLTTNQICETPINFRCSERYFVGMQYTQPLGKLYLTGTGLLSFPKDSYPYLNQQVHTNKVGVELSFNAYCNLSKTIKAFSTFYYQNAYERYNYYQKMANDWTIGIQGKFWHERVALTIKATDILHKANYNNLTMYYKNTAKGTFGTNDMRGISISASVNLFNKDLSVDACRNSDDVLKRTN